MEISWSEGWFSGGKSPCLCWYVQIEGHETQIRSINYDSDLGSIYELFVFFFIKPSMIKRNVKRRASGMMLNKPGHKKADISTQVSANIRYWSKSLFLPCPIPSVSPGSPLLGLGSLPCRAGHAKLPTWFQAKPACFALLRGRGGYSPEKCSWKGSLWLPISPTTSFDMLGNRILNYLWFFFPTCHLID